MSKKQIQIALVTVLALISSIVTYPFLPDALEQRGGGVMPRLVYVTVAFLLSVLFSTLYYFKGKKTYLYTATLGVIIPICAVFFGNVF